VRAGDSGRRVLPIFSGPVRPSSLSGRVCGAVLRGGTRRAGAFLSSADGLAAGRSVAGLVTSGVRSAVRARGVLRKDWGLPTRLPLVLRGFSG